MSVGWIKTEEQRARHIEGCRRRYASYKDGDPDFLKKQYARKVELVAELPTEDVTRLKEKTRINAKRHYNRNRDKLLRPDQAKREAVIRHLGAICVECGYEADIRALVLDHIRGDGYLDRQRLGSKVSRHYSKHLDEAEANLQVLCHNCNAIKAVENKEHNRSRRLDA